MLKENGYQESIISKIFKRITNNHSLPQSQQLTQAADIQKEEIRMSINLPYVESTSEKYRVFPLKHFSSFKCKVLQGSIGKIFVCNEYVFRGVAGEDGR